jgi:tRNA(adenine34) deaminase
MIAPEATEQDRAAMVRALHAAAQASAIGEVPVGCVIYQTESGHELACAANRREVDGDPLAHAEMLAIREAARKLGDWRLSGCTLVVTLEPCAMCAGAIVNSRVDRLVIGAMDPKAGACGSLMSIVEDSRLNHRVVPIRGVLAEQSAELLREFFRGLRG